MAFRRRDVALTKHVVPPLKNQGDTKRFMHAFMSGVAVSQAQYGIRPND